MTTEPAEVVAAEPLRGPSRLRRLWRSYGVSALLILFILVAWEVGLRAAHVPKYELPVPSEIYTSLKVDWAPYLRPGLVATSIEMVLGFLASAAVGVGLAVLLHLVAPLRRALYPLLISSQTIPIVVVAPIIVILLNYGIAPKILIVALICFFPVVVNGLDGLRTVDDDYIHMMRTLDATRWAIFRRVEFPAALPAIFSGLRVAATFAAIGAVFAEYAGSNQGLGYVMLESTANLATDRIFAAIFLLTLAAIALFGVVSGLERWLVPWASKGDAM